MRRLILVAVLCLVFVGVAQGKLIAHYRMNDNAASATVVDESGVHNGVYHGTGGADDYTNAHAVVGKIHGALSFASPDYVEIADHIAFSPILKPFSISAWVNMTDASSFFIVNKMDSLISNCEWELRTDSTDHINFSIIDDTYAHKISREHSVALTDYEGQWIHIVGTYNGGASHTGLRIYLNSVRVDDTDVSSGIFVKSENKVSHVRMGNLDVAYSSGSIDNVMIFDTELTQYEVDILYNGGGGTENPADLDDQIAPRRCGNSKFPLRRRYEF